MTRMHSSSEYIRIVGGAVKSVTIVEKSMLRVEVHRRRCGGSIDWHFRQPQPALLWHRTGYFGFQGTINGEPVRSSLLGPSRLSLFPAETEIKLRFDVEQDFEYVAVFFNGDFPFGDTLQDIESPLLAFGHDDLTRGLGGVCDQAQSPDKFFDLFLEGWALQALAHLARLAPGRDTLKHNTKGGLPKRSLKQIETFVAYNLADDISVDAMAAVAGLSRRHFTRVFMESTGTSPHDFVIAQRIAAARRLLLESDLDITALALSCGFCHAQHFSTSFKKATGITPSEFRRLHS